MVDNKVTDNVYKVSNRQVKRILNDRHCVYQTAGRIYTKRPSAVVLKVYSVQKKKRKRKEGRKICANAKHLNLDLGYKLIHGYY